ncbi:hypothetical protein VTI74DRAFT_4638 [Chaetomium olivicolor]
MSGTVLSMLCSICHTEVPKYRCPRCGARTCSLPCVQKHKARADCDGVRNPRAFMPLSQLKTEAGIDHDFNFLTSIERARRNAEKDIVEARNLLSEKDLRPPGEDKLFQKVWYGDEMRHVPINPNFYNNKKHGRPLEGPKAIDAFDKHVRRRLRYLDIETVTMPKGMARQRENKTAFNRRTGTVNWQVEWFVYDAHELGVGLSAQQDATQRLRILYKSLEGTPLNKALASTLDWHRGQLDRQSRELQADPTKDNSDSEADETPRKKRKTHHNTKKTAASQFQPQDFTTSAWPAANPVTFQSPLTSAWSETTTSPSLPVTLEEKLSNWQFFLAKAARPMPATKTLIPLRSTESLASALTGRTVVEFPTVYVMPAGRELPTGYMLGDAAERRAPVMREVKKSGERCESNKNGNRKRAFAGREGAGRGGKRAKVDDERRSVSAAHEVVEQPVPEREPDSELESELEAEEGEINSDGNEVVGDAAGEEKVENAEVMDLDGYVGRDVDSGSDSSRTLDGEEGQMMEKGAVTLRGGLVDYGSSDEDD